MHSVYRASSQPVMFVVAAESVPVEENRTSLIKPKPYSSCAVCLRRENRFTLQQRLLRKIRQAAVRPPVKSFVRVANPDAISAVFCNYRRGCQLKPCRGREVARN